jgi:hypothetical protein
MASIFPGSASVGQIFEGYLFNGTAWDLIGNEFNPTSFSPNAPDNPKAGDLWVDSDSNVPSISNETILTIDSASATYATKAELSNIDALPSQSGNTGKYLTTNGSAASWSTIDLTSAINTASAAAVTYLVDSAPATLDTLNELAAALNDDANFSSTVTTSLGNKLDTSTASSTYLTQASGLTQASASTTYLSKNEASSTYLTSASMQTVPVYVMNSGSSAQRPVSPSNGMFRFNTDSGYPEWYSSEDSAWYNFYQQPNTSYDVEYLLVAGGGGGAYDSGGGGGGGGLLQGLSPVDSGISYIFTVGAGGAVNTIGGNTTGFTLTATGGGKGGGGSGGSGGGATAAATGIGTGIAGQGFNGGAAAWQTAVSGAGGGGGGAGGVGQSAPANNNSGNGGPGINWQSLGTTYSSGGKGSNNSTGYAAAVGNGHGGGGYNPGRDGIVIVRYVGSQRGTGGVVSSGNGYTYHTFTTSGTFFA